MGTKFPQSPPPKQMPVVGPFGLQPSPPPPPPKRRTLPNLSDEAYHEVQRLGESVRCPHCGKGLKLVDL